MDDVDALADPTPGAPVIFPGVCVWTPWVLRIFLLTGAGLVV